MLSVIDRFDSLFFSILIEFLIFIIQGVFMGEKPIIFLSHIHEEKELAISLKKLIEGSFIGAVNIFVSSDSSSNGVGEKWLDNITNSLKSCVIAILLCSRESIKRPWLNFEAGAVWMRNILVVPVCHSGLSKTELPIPLSLLNAIGIKSQEELTDLFTSIAGEIGLNVPKIDLSHFIQEVQEVEDKNQFWDKLNGYFTKLEKRRPGILDILKTNKSVTLAFHQSSADKEEVDLIKSFMERHNLLNFSNFRGNSNFGGAWYAYDINSLPRFHQVICVPG